MYLRVLFFKLSVGLCENIRMWLFFIEPSVNAKNLHACACVCVCCLRVRTGVSSSASWPTSMSLSGLRSWSHRMILWSLPPPVRRVPFLSWHSVNTLPSWALIWRLIWNAPEGERGRKTEIICKQLRGFCWRTRSVFSFSLKSMTGKLVHAHRAERERGAC